MTDLSGQNGLAAWIPGRLAELAPTVTVVGDVMLDGWWSGTIDRLCREAPAPVVEVTRRTFVPGGAANTAMNLAAMGAQVRLAGLIGADFAGRRLRSLLTEAGIDISALIEHAGITTTTKYRIVSGDQVILRLDESGREYPADAVAELARAMGHLTAQCEAIVVCDYGSGALSEQLKSVLGGARGQRPLTVVDAHDPRAWAGIEPDLVTPNAQEAATVLGLRVDHRVERAALFAERGSELLTSTGAATAVVTLDRDGSVLLNGDGATHRTWARPATEKQASGAGDTFVAALTLGRCAGLPLTTSVDLAQAAADVVVHRFGTSVCSTADLTRHLDALGDQAMDPVELGARIAAARAVGERIVLTNGCFDVLHRGHTRYLNQAKQLGDILIVALNSDESARRLKGPGRPINSVGDRAGVLAALSCVDYVTVFDTDTPIPLIESLRPDIYAKGGDYSPQMLAETPVVHACGGQVRILDYVPDHSTTEVARRIRAMPEPAEVSETPAGEAGDAGEASTERAVESAEN